MSSAVHSPPLGMSALHEHSPVLNSTGITFVRPRVLCILCLAASLQPVHTTRLRVRVLVSATRAHDTSSCSCVDAPPTPCARAQSAPYMPSGSALQAPRCTRVGPTLTHVPGTCHARPFHAQGACPCVHMALPMHPPRLRLCTCTHPAPTRSMCTDPLRALHVCHRQCTGCASTHGVLFTS